MSGHVVATTAVGATLGVLGANALGPAPVGHTIGAALVGGSWFGGTAWLSAHQHASPMLLGLGGAALGAGAMLAAPDLHPGANRANSVIGAAIVYGGITALIAYVNRTPRRAAITS